MKVLKKLTIITMVIWGQIALAISPTEVEKLCRQAQAQPATRDGIAIIRNNLKTIKKAGRTYNQDVMKLEELLDTRQAELAEAEQRQREMHQLREIEQLRADLARNVALLDQARDVLQGIEHEHARHWQGVLNPMIQELERLDNAGRANAEEALRLRGQLEAAVRRAQAETASRE